MRNIVVILCDQLRPDFLRMYGCEAIPTPNLDRLASCGVVFDHAITQSTVCAPARATMMTGTYVSEHGVWTNDRPFAPGMEYIAERMNDLDRREAQDALDELASEEEEDWVDEDATAHRGPDD